jgi:hypothetical protein
MQNKYYSEGDKLKLIGLAKEFLLQFQQKIGKNGLIFLSKRPSVFEI